MRILVFSTRSFERQFLEETNRNVHTLRYCEHHLTPVTVEMARGFDAVITGVYDRLDASLLEALHNRRIHFIVTRTTGYEHIDIACARALGIKVANIPEYLSSSIAEFTIGMILTLNRRLRETAERVKKHDFTLDGLEGFSISGKTVGIIGLGSIGTAVASILNGFGCRLLGHDLIHYKEVERKFRLKFTELDELLASSDIITLHVPLNDTTIRLLNKDNMRLLKPGAMLINTSRGGVVDTQAAFDALKAGKLGYLGLDVYEKETEIFGKDFRNRPSGDPLLDEMLEHPNIFISAHQAFLTREALQNIAKVTFYNINAWAKGFRSKNELA
jgi:D-lactate dehydrogenase